jgi:hypothetical protein
MNKTASHIFNRLMLLVGISLFTFVGSVYAASDTIKIVKGQVSNYYISVIKEYTISGLVTGPNGKPLQGASVMFFSSPVHCNTDASGHYALKGSDRDTCMYVYYPNLAFARFNRKVSQHKVDIQLKDRSQEDDQDILPRQKAISTKWYNPEDVHTTTYCNPLNISYNYEPYDNNVQRGGCFRSSADPMALTYKGQYLLFSTNQGGFHYSNNLSDWNFQTASFQRFPTDDDQCAPAAFVSRDTLFYTGSTYEGLPIWYSMSPMSGRWRQAVNKNTLPSWDPCFFLDDDGRLYLYYGSSNEYPLKAVELSRNTFKPISKIEDVIMLHPKEHGWERFGMNNDDSTTLKPFTEGAYMTKHNGRYYLQYGAPGTEFKTYADGVYVGTSPLGPFTYQIFNPMSYKPGGFVQGTGHGGTFQDLHGQYWHVATCMLSLKYKFERRIGLYPTYFDQNGIMYTNTAFGDYPQRNADYTGTDRFSGWMLLSLGKKMTASSTDTLDVKNLSDENLRTYWSAKNGNPGEWVTMDLGKVMDVRAVQLNFYDHHTQQTNRANDTYYQYRIYASLDGEKWKLAIDKSDNDRDVPHDYVELKTVLNTRYLKIENLHIPGNGNFCMSEFRVFGKSTGNKPEQVKDFKVRRSSKDTRNVMISWQNVAGAYGYNIYYGTAPDKLYHCITVNQEMSYDFRGLDRNTTYYFAIEALGETGISKRSKILQQ